MHYTVPLTAGAADGYQFPGEYCGQYGVYDAIKHIYSQSREFEGLVKDDSLLINKNHFAVDMERALDHVRDDFRRRH